MTVFTQEFIGTLLTEEQRVLVEGELAKLKARQKAHEENPQPILNSNEELFGYPAHGMAEMCFDHDIVMMERTLETGIIQMGEFLDAPRDHTQLRELFERVKEVCGDLNISIAFPSDLDRKENQIPPFGELDELYPPIKSQGLSIRVLKVRSITPSQFTPGDFNDGI